METMHGISYSKPLYSAFGKTFEPEFSYENILDFFNSKGLKVPLALDYQFFYITDLNRFDNVFVSPNVKRIIGVEPEEFGELQNVHNLIHPEDREFVWEFSIRTLEFSRKYRDILQWDPYSAVFSIDFRIRSCNGNYIRVNRQTSCYNTDCHGNMLYALSLFTNIDHLKRNNFMTYAWNSYFELDSEKDDLNERVHKNIITNREIEIIRLLSQGMSAIQISKKLFISPNTVIKHRKNILHKTGAKNTAELICYAMAHGVI